MCAINILIPESIFLKVDFFQYPGTGRSNLENKERFTAATVSHLRCIWSRTAGPGRARRTPGPPYSRRHRRCCCCSWPWSGWSTRRRFCCAAAWSSGPAAAGCAAAGQPVQKPPSWYIPASSRTFVSGWLPSDSSSTARYPSEGRKKTAFEALSKPQTGFCPLIDTAINHQERGFIFIFDRGDGVSPRAVLILDLEPLIWPLVFSSFVCCLKLLGFFGGKKTFPFGSLNRGGNRGHFHLCIINVSSIISKCKNNIWCARPKATWRAV